MLNGIEQTIEFFSRIMPLEPGAVIHMGTMGIDGFTVERDMELTTNDYMEIEFEGVGKLRNPIVDLRNQEDKIWNQPPITG